MTVVIGTAGHIDHGKTALLRTLTGIDADRLPEERRRGMTIDVGYAHMRLVDGVELDFVDVPGHDRLIGNMLVGAGEIQAALFVVAADDGPRAQTVEHLTLLDGLQINLGVVAITKADLVDEARICAVEAQVRELLNGTSLEGAPIVPVSALDGRGIDRLSAALADLRDRVLERLPDAPPDAPVRLAIDRAFVIRGRGSVVTGSLRGGSLRSGSQLRLVPGDRIVRARELQVHGASRPAVGGGGRVAINLAAIDVDDLPRGAVLTTDARVHAGTALIALLRPGLAGERAAGIAPGSVYRLHLGTDQVQATVGRGRADLAVTAAGVVARLRLARPVALAGGDRFVLRRASASGVVVGGQVIDPQPPIGASRRRVQPADLAGLAAPDPLSISAAVVRIHGVVEPSQLFEVAGITVTAGSAASVGAVALGGVLVAGSIVRDLADNAVAIVQAASRSAVSDAGVPLAEMRARLRRRLQRVATVTDRTAADVIDGLLAQLAADGRIGRSGDHLHGPGPVMGRPAAITAAMDRLEAALTTVAPPALAEAVHRAGCPPDGVRALQAAGRIVRLDENLAYAGGTYRTLAESALRMATARALTPAALRDETGTSRKYVMAILEDLDRRGILKRTPAGHVPGPRAAALADIGSNPA